MEKVLDYKGRWRSHTVAFRVSEEEAKLINDLVALSGLTLADQLVVGIHPPNGIYRNLHRPGRFSCSACDCRCCLFRK